MNENRWCLTLRSRLLPQVPRLVEGWGHTWRMNSGIGPMEPDSIRSIDTSVQPRCTYLFQFPSTIRLNGITLELLPSPVTSKFVFKYHPYNSSIIFVSGNFISCYLLSCKISPRHFEPNASFRSFFFKFHRSAFKMRKLTTKTVILATWTYPNYN